MIEMILTLFLENSTDKIVVRFCFFKTIQSAFFIWNGLSSCALEIRDGLYLGSICTSLPHKARMYLVTDPEDGDRTNKTNKKTQATKNLSLLAHVYHHLLHKKDLMRINDKLDLKSR